MCNAPRATACLTLTWSNATFSSRSMAGMTSNRPVKMDYFLPTVDNPIQRHIEIYFDIRAMRGPFPMMSKKAAK